MNRVLLVRHGQSVWNEQFRVQGQTGSGLTALGRSQAEATAAHLGQMLSGSVAVVSSDLQRCQETVGPIAESLEADVAWDPDLRERCFGSWEGRTIDELATEDSPTWRRWAAGEDVVDAVGGESAAALAARATPAIRRHADDAETVVLVTHGGVVWHCLHELLSLPPLTLGGVANASISEVLFSGDRTWLNSYNNDAHISAAERTTFRPQELRGARR